MNKVKGNKLIIIMATLVLAFYAVVFLVVQMDDFFGWNYVRTDSAGIVYKRFGDASVVSFKWDGNPDNMAFTVPDEFDGHQIKVFGGKYGQYRPFHIDIVHDDETFKCTKDLFDNYQLDNDHTYDEYVFVINLGANISEINIIDENLYGVRETTDDNGNSIDEIVYRISYYFNVDPENKTFYSENGVVYWKDTNEPVEELIDSIH